MGKIKFTVLFVFLISNQLFGTDWYSELRKNFILSESLFAACEYGIKRRDYTLKMYSYNYDISTLSLADNGFLIGNIDMSWLTENVDKIISHYFVLGDEDIFFVSKYITKDTREKYSCTITFLNDMNIKNSKEFWKYKDEYYSSMHPESPSYTSIKTSSALTETNAGVTFVYDGARMDEYFLGDAYKTLYNIYAMPWVEGVEGTGIGEWIEVEAHGGRRVFYVLNGFVDPYRIHLYKQNSRVRDAMVIGTTEDGRELEQQVKFEDFVYFKTIIFPEPVLKMKLIIKSVYPGEKWQDTTISAILLSKMEDSGKYVFKD